MWHEHVWINITTEALYWWAYGVTNSVLEGHSRELAYFKAEYPEE